MKRFVLSVFMSMFLFTTAFSQLTLLLEGGANYGKGNLSENGVLAHENIVGYYLAGIPKFEILNSMKLFSEIQYSVEGSDVKSVRVQVDNLMYRTHYFRVIPGVEVDLVGPISFLVGANIGFAALEMHALGSRKFERSITGFYQKKSDIGLLAGLNLNLLGVNFTAKYNLGLRNILDINITDIDGNFIEDVNLKSRFLQVGLGYEFGR